MQERLRPFDGEFEINGQPNKGTNLKITIPLSEVVIND
jgi:signal transduction histidine kinase